jgi:GTP-binding protein
VKRKSKGVLIALEPGSTITYALYNLQDRGQIFLPAGVPVYPGMIVGEHSKENDLVVNVCKTKKLTNMRASGSDESMRLTPPKRLSLEQALEFINDDELLEVTPENIRIRKKILNADLRAKATKKAKAMA